ncbi:MAG: type II toxin-antitoxin system VapC family toxin [Pirellulales bacterium]|nr:type II toxin-antitoxin system VapC family toxin [Pirellulales bacterium]
MDDTLLDTDILSEILKAKNPQVMQTAERYLAQHQRFAFSAITFYEILRGLRANQALRALNEFLRLAEDSEILPISLPFLKRAADLWGEARQSGRPRNDTDLIIAATALETRRVLVTGNTTHFAWIPGLSLMDWRAA